MDNLAIIELIRTKLRLLEKGAKNDNFLGDSIKWLNELEFRLKTNYKE